MCVYFSFSLQNRDFSIIQTIFEQTGGGLFEDSGQQPVEREITRRINITIFIHHVRPPLKHSRSPRKREAYVYV